MDAAGVVDAAVDAADAADAVDAADTASAMLISDSFRREPRLGAAGGGLRGLARNPLFGCPPWVLLLLLLLLLVVSAAEAEARACWTAGEASKLVV